MRDLSTFQGWRLTFFQGVLVAVFAIFAIRMYDLQIDRQADFQAAADDNRLSILPLAADRGVIYDRNNVLLARNAPAYVVEITPAALPSDTAGRYEIYNRISALTGVPPTFAAEQQGTVFVRSIERIVKEGEGIAPFTPVAVATDIDRQAAVRLLEDRISLPGVDVRTVAVREYPTGELTSHVVGYMGPVSAEVAEALRELGFDPRFEREGYAGIEAYMENVLAGERGSITREIDVAGEVQRELSVVPPTAGNSLRLTIDVDLQAAAQAALTSMLDRLQRTVAVARTRHPEPARGCHRHGSAYWRNPRLSELPVLRQHTLCPRHRRRVLPDRSQRSAYAAAEQGIGIAVPAGIGVEADHRGGRA
ncbi:MAG: hypothetical protein HND48_15250 [Chloroflexi bacterium]|nr:hypothetical protein [Chloroflexota bacterium]